MLILKNAEFVSTFEFFRFFDHFLVLTRKKEKFLKVQDSKVKELATMRIKRSNVVGLIRPEILT